MSLNITISIIITVLVGAPFIVVGIIMLKGRGAFLIAGYNTMSKSEQEKYDAPALCRFIGKIMLAIGALTVLLPAGIMLERTWAFWLYMAGVLVLSVFAAVYANTGNRFKK